MGMQVLYLNDIGNGSLRPSEAATSRYLERHGHPVTRSQVDWYNPHRQFGDLL